MNHKEYILIFFIYQLYLQIIFLLIMLVLFHSYQPLFLIGTVHFILSFTFINTIFISVIILTF